MADEGGEDVVIELSAIREELAALRRDTERIMTATRRAQRFWPNVTTNAIANLVAAAVLYVLAVASGYLRLYPALFIPAATLIGLAVTLVFFGGLRYVTSAGDQGTVTRAKNTIMYGLLAIAFELPWIVGYVVGAGPLRHLWPVALPAGIGVFVTAAVGAVILGRSRWSPKELPIGLLVVLAIADLGLMVGLG